MHVGWLSESYLVPADNGAMVTGWKQVGGTWYFLDSSGTMVQGWRQIDSSWVLLRLLRQHVCRPTDQRSHVLLRLLG